MKGESKDGQEEVRELLGIYVWEDLSHCDCLLIADAENKDMQKKESWFSAGRRSQIVTTLNSILLFPDRLHQIWQSLIYWLMGVEYWWMERLLDLYL